MELPTGCPLTRGEFECARLLCEGLRVKEIAVRRNRSESSVRGMLLNARRRLGLRTVRQLVPVMAASGWVDYVDTEWEDERVTAAQSLYLAAFERWLRDPNDETVERRAFWLRGMFYEADVTPPWEATPQARSVSPL